MKGVERLLEKRLRSLVRVKVLCLAEAHWMLFLFSEYMTYGLKTWMARYVEGGILRKARKQMLRMVCSVLSRWCK